jgi:hypothetical protein
VEEAAAPVYFETEPGPPVVEGAESSSSVEANEATLNATINASNEKTTYFFEYSTSEAKVLAGKGTKVAGPGEIEGGSQGVSVTVPGLAQQTKYYFRAVAENAQSKKEPKPAEGAVEEFTTLPQVPAVQAPSPVGGTTATLQGVLSPTATVAGEGGEYEFVYWQSATECEYPNEATEKVEYKQTPVAASLGAAKEAVSAAVTGLLPDTTYTYCLLARSSTGVEELSAPQTFTTPTIAPIIESETASDVSDDEARMDATVNPGALETGYRFEYGPAAGAYDVSVPVPAGEIPAGIKSVNISGVATGLQPSTTYHYRVVVSNAKSPPGGTPGPDEAFTTLAAQGSTTAETCPNAQAHTEQPYGQALPDCRAYEMVSPLDKSSSNVLAVDSRASVSGEALTYISPGSFSEPKGTELESRYLSHREPEHDRWSTENITPPHTLINTRVDTPFGGLFFTPSLSAGVVESALQPLAPGEEAGYFNLDVADLATSPISYQTITDLNEKTAGEKPYEEAGGRGEPPAGVSTDLSHVVFKSSRSGHIYEWADGKLSQVDISPAGTQFQYKDEVGAPGSGFAFDGDTWHAVSETGLHVFFTGGEYDPYGPEGQVYVRENPEQPQSPQEKGKCTVSSEACTVEVSTSQRSVPDPNNYDPEVGGPYPAYYRDANAAGTRVFFTSRAELTNDANTKEDQVANFYEYNLETGALSDLTADNAEGAAVLGLVTAGENAGEENSYVYFVANGVLASNENANKETAQPGNCKEEQEEQLTGEHTCNLYVAHYGGGKWETKFIATLAGGINRGSDVYGDENDWVGFEGGTQAADNGPGRHTVRVTPDGATLAFESERRLTGYDNEPVEPGAGSPQGRCTETGAKLEAGNPPAPCREVYLYNVETGSHPPTLVCASCDPSGERPVGPAEELASGAFKGIVDQETDAFYRPRNLSEDGKRLFFQSLDALVPQDSNGKLDVYEWEAQGEGSCTQAAGCVLPISDVAGDYESLFMDASPSGEDVFIGTADQLVPSDTDTRVDVYDVKVGGGFPTPPAPPMCNNGDSCKSPVSPQPSVFGAPASATFSGPGNPAPYVAPPPPKKTVKCKKNFVKKKVKKKETCVKRKSKKSKRAKRAGRNRRGN